MSSSDEALSGSDVETVEAADVAPPPATERKASTASRMKKFFASKTAATSVGRKVITSFLGDEGAEMLHAAKHAAIKFSSKKQGKQLKKDIIKLALKAKIAGDEKKITPEQTVPLMEPIRTMASAFLKILNGEPGEQDVMPTSNALKEVGVKTCELMKPVVKPKNHQKLEAVFAFYSDPLFLGKLVNDLDYEEEKEIVKVNMDSIVRVMLHDIALKQPGRRKCIVKTCPLLSMEERLPFKGSEYCGRHHVEHVQAELDDPSFFHFAEPSNPKSAYFISYLTEYDNSPEGEASGNSTLATYHLFDTLQQYRQVQPAVKKSRARLIFRKFIAPPREESKATAASVHNASLSDSITMPDTIRQKIGQELRLHSTGTSNKDKAALNHLYDEAYKEVESQMQNIFPAFRASAQYEAYVASITLPDELRSESERTLARRRESMVRGAAPPAAEEKAA